MPTQCIILALAALVGVVAADSVEEPRIDEAFLISQSETNETCFDRDRHCFDYVALNGTDCENAPYIKANCEKTCQFCGEVDKKYDVKNMPDALRPLAFLLGVWRAESGGKAIFPTMPVFTYGEEIEISLPDSSMRGLGALNYTAHAWDMNKHQALHSEHGYITMKPGSKEVALTTVMDNGFVTIEQGPLHGKSITFTLKDIGRISFSRDLPVHGTERDWRLVDPNTFEHRFFMETLTHRMQLHTSIVYRRVYPRS